MSGKYQSLVLPLFFCFVTPNLHPREIDGLVSHATGAGSSGSGSSAVTNRQSLKSVHTQDFGIASQSSSPDHFSSLLFSAHSTTNTATNDSNASAGVARGSGSGSEESALLAESSRTLSDLLKVAEGSLRQLCPVLVHRSKTAAFHLQLDRMSDGACDGDGDNVGGGGCGGGDDGDASGKDWSGPREDIAARQGEVCSTGQAYPLRVSFSKDHSPEKSTGSSCQKTQNKLKLYCFVGVEPITASFRHHPIIYCLCIDFT